MPLSRPFTARNCHANSLRGSQGIQKGYERGRGHCMAVLIQQTWKAGQSKSPYRLTSTEYSYTDPNATVKQPLSCDPIYE